MLMRYKKRSCIEEVEVYMCVPSISSLIIIIAE